MNFPQECDCLTIVTALGCFLGVRRVVVLYFRNEAGLTPRFEAQRTLCLACGRVFGVWACVWRVGMWLLGCLLSAQENQRGLWLLEVSVALLIDSGVLVSLPAFPGCMSLSAH